MQRFAETIKPTIVYLEKNLPALNTIPGFIFWCVTLYILAWIATLLCGPLLMAAEPELRAK